MRVGVAPDVDEQRGVVDDRPRVVVEAEPLGDAQRDQGLPQHVLHRLPEAEVDPERERRDELGQPDGRSVGVGAHARLGRALTPRPRAPSLVGIGLCTSGEPHRPVRPAWAGTPPHVTPKTIPSRRGIAVRVGHVL